MNLENYLQQTDNSEVKYWINHNLKNHLTKQPEIIGEIEHIIDYLNSEKAPSRLKKMSYNEAKNSSEKWVKSLIKNSKNIIETDADARTIITFDDGMRLVQLVGLNAFKREGNLMAHCVESYHGKGDVKVYSLRDGKNEPHCTMEVSRGDNINQIKGKGNGSIHPKYIEYVIKSLEFFGMDVRDSEMANLGYSNPSEDLFALILKEFVNVKYVSFKGKNFLYNQTQLVRK